MRWKDILGYAGRCAWQNCGRMHGKAGCVSVDLEARLRTDAQGAGLGPLISEDPKRMNFFKL